MVTVDSAHLVKLVEDELRMVRDSAVRDQIQALLVNPAKRDCRWDYWEWDKAKYEETYPCWTVMTDTAGGRLAIVYCEHGFGPACPWGLIRMDEDTPSMGQDSGWSSTFLEAAAEILDLPPERLMN